MLKGLKSNSYRFVVVLLLLLTFLTTGMVGKVIPSYALAAPVPELAPVFDTQIYQLQDYFEQNIEGTPHEPVFYLILGCYLVLQAGMNDYQIVDPYTTSDGVTGWLKSTGIQLWNSLNSFVSFDPVTGTDLRPTFAPLIAYALGASELAYKYNSEETFLDDVSNSDNFYLPFDQSLQIGINTVLAQNGGLYNWQFTYNDFVSESNFTWKTISEISDGQDLLYNEYVNTYIDREHVFFANARSSDYYNTVMSSSALHTYLTSHHNLFLNMSNHTWALLDDEGNGDIYPVYSSYPVTWVNYYNYNGRGYAQKVENYSLTYYTSYTYDASFTPSQFVAYYLTMSGMQYYNSIYYFNPWLFIEHVYYGLSWEGKTEMLNRSDLNFSDDYQQYYLQVTNDYLFDIKGLLSDLVNITNLYPVIKDNIYDTNGDLVVNLPTVNVSVDIVDTNPLPVNLNDVELYLDNDYLDVVKQSATDYGNTIGQWFVFWHNSDPALLYTLLGSAIVILVGAFIGKWGHS